MQITTIKVHIMVTVVPDTVLDSPCIMRDLLDKCQNIESISFSAARISHGIGVSGMLIELEPVMACRINYVD